MSLSLALNNALSGLNINQRQLSVLSQNIANANTAGYSRQVLNQSAVYVGSVGQGVQAESVTRKIDEYLRRSVQSQSASVGATNTMNEYYSRMQILLGQPGSANGVDSYVTTFFNSMQSLAQSPELVSRQQNAVSGAIALGNQLSSLAQQTHELRFEADTDIVNSVRYVNQQLADLHSLNTAISRASILGSDTAGLLDQRDGLIRNISQYIDVNANFKPSGEVQLSTSNGVALLDQSAYRLNYTNVSSVDALVGDVPLSPITVSRLDTSGNPTGELQTLVSGGTSENVVSTLKSGSLKALVELRDKTLPGVLAQLDTIAATVRDQVNAIHNKGTGYPAANMLTGTRTVTAQSASEWSGSVRIAILNAQGQPVQSPYADEPYGLSALTLNLGSLNSGSSDGRISVQTIINEINTAFTPQNKAKVGNLNNIRLASLTPAMPTTPASFSFDFDLENISGTGSNFFVNGITVRDANGVTLPGNVTSSQPSVPLASSNTFVTHAVPNDNVVTVNTGSAHGFTEGQRVYLGNPGAVPNVNGISNAAMTGYFVVSNVTANGFDVTVAGNATSAGGVNLSGLSAKPAYDQVAPGTSGRTGDHGSFNLDLTANPTSAYYDIDAQVAVEDGNGGFTTTTVTYRVLNHQQNMLNQRASASAVASGGSLVQPTNTQPYAVAKLVDAQGKELPKINGVYVEQPGFLKIETVNGNYSIAIDEMDSKQLGMPYDVPPAPGTNRGFSHFFEMNNLFKSNKPTATGDTLKGSALSLAIESRIANNASLISLGSLVRSNQPAGAGETPRYTYQRNSGDSQAIKQIADIATKTIAFSAAGGLPGSTQTLSSFAAQFLGYNASQASSAESNLKDTQILLSGFEQRAQSISGVNLDEELANTIVYQNAYTASARVISVTNDLYDALLSTFQ